MIATSVAIPPMALWHRARGEAATLRWARAVDAVLFDRDGTLVFDVPYNGDPDLVQPVPGAVEAVGRLRAAQVPTGVVSNQSGVAKGLLAPADVDAVNERLGAMVGPNAPWNYCTHGYEDACACRHTHPGLIAAAGAALGSRVECCVVIGDTGADVQAAHAAGARAILVPNGRTRGDEVRDAPVVADDLNAAVDYVMARAVGS